MGFYICPYEDDYEAEYAFYVTAIGADGRERTLHYGDDDSYGRNDPELMFAKEGKEILAEMREIGAHCCKVSGMVYMGLEEGGEPDELVEDWEDCDVTQEMWSEEEIEGCIEDGEERAPRMHTGRSTVSARASPHEPVRNRTDANNLKNDFPKHIWRYRHMFGYECQGYLEELMDHYGLTEGRSSLFDLEESYAEKDAAWMADKAYWDGGAAYGWWFRAAVNRRANVATAVELCRQGRDDELTAGYCSVRIMLAGGGPWIYADTMTGTISVHMIGGLCETVKMPDELVRCLDVTWREKYESLLQNTDFDDPEEANNFWSQVDLADFDDQGVWHVMKTLPRPVRSGPGTEKPFKEEEDTPSGADLPPSDRTAPLTGDAMSKIKDAMDSGALQEQMESGMNQWLKTLPLETGAEIYSFGSVTMALDFAHDAVSKLVETLEYYSEKDPQYRPMYLHFRPMLDWMLRSPADLDDETSSETPSKGRLHR